METPPGNPGEIEIQGFNVMNGYYQRPSETAKVLSGDGWMKTGDIGYLDERGNLHILGRMKDMIIHGGENISPQEVEEVILNMKGIRQVKVFGIEEAVIQENIVACIETDVKYTVEEVRHFVKRYLADYKVPKYIVFFSKLPENASGKIDVQQLKRMILNSWETISKSF
jgi:acyl-CoA synthetase (AMP-forming)/AMP-acid ligase II